MNFSISFFLKIIIVLTLFISLITGYYFSLNFNLKKVIVKPSKPAIKLPNQLTNQNLLFLNINQIKKEVLALNPNIQTVNLTKQYPDQLLITYRISLPIIQIKTNGQYLLISKEGKIISKQENKERNLLMVNYYQRLRSFESRLGEIIINQDILSAVAVASEAARFNLSINNLTIKKPGQIEAKLVNEGPLIIFSTKKSIAKNWRIVHNILKSLKVKGEQPKEINLLFDKPFFIL